MMTLMLYGIANRAGKHFRDSLLLFWHYSRMTQNLYPSPKASGFKRIIKALGYSRDGLSASFRDEAAFRQEVILGVMLMVLACVIAPDLIGLGLMIGSILIVWICELINTAIEAVVDLSTTEHHPLAKKAKDTGSAAVLIALILAVVIWTTVLI